MERKLIAALACRNDGSRLFGKPLQNLDVEAGFTILDYIIQCLQTITVIDEVVLGISKGKSNQVFIDVANKYGLKYVIGEKLDVVSRIIQCGKLANATDIFRVTSESPFFNFAMIEDSWIEYVDLSLDALFLDDVIDGCGFEFISMPALEESHLNGCNTELVTYYIRNNLNDFKVSKINPPEFLVRKDLRLTVDNPEDLVVCRHIFNEFRDMSPRIPLNLIVSFLDKNPHLIDLFKPYLETGYSTMYIWENE